MTENNAEIMVVCPKCENVYALSRAELGIISCTCGLEFPIDTGEIIDVEWCENGKVKMYGRKLDPIEICYKKSIFHNKIFIPLQVILVVTGLILFLCSTSILLMGIQPGSVLLLLFVITWNGMFSWIISPKLSKFIRYKAEQYAEKLEDEEYKNKFEKKQ